MLPSTNKDPEGASFNYTEKVPLKWLCFCGLRIRNMMKRTFKKFVDWLLEVEMGFVWGTAGCAIIMFVFAAIWYIDPALLTLVLRFRQARCVTRNQAFLIGISNCSWTSCRLGCTREIYRCWQIQVSSSHYYSLKGGGRCIFNVSPMNNLVFHYKFRAKL